MERSEGRILTSHTGALFLPPRDDHGPVGTPTDRDAIKDRVASIVAKQAEIGIDVVNNGDLTVGAGLEMPRAFDGIDAVPIDEGYGIARGIRTPTWRPTPSTRRPGPVTAGSTEPIEWDAQTLTAAARGQDVQELFLTFLGPGWMSRFIFDEHYGDEQALIDALAEATRPFYRAIVDAGHILQTRRPPGCAPARRRLDLVTAGPT